MNGASSWRNFPWNAADAIDIIGGMKKTTAAALLATCLHVACAAVSESRAEGGAGRTEVSFLMAYTPDHPEEPSTRRLLAFAGKHPEVHLSQWGGLTLPGGGGRATFMLALAGGSALRRAMARVAFQERLDRQMYAM